MKCSSGHMGEATALDVRLHDGKLEIVSGYITIVATLSSIHTGGLNRGVVASVMGTETGMACPGVFMLAGPLNSYVCRCSDYIVYKLRIESTVGRGTCKVVGFAWELQGEVRLMCLRVCRIVACLVKELHLLQPGIRGMFGITRFSRSMALCYHQLADAQVV